MEKKLLLLVASILLTIGINAQILNVPGGAGGIGSTGNGNVGIGTTSPGYKLDVIGSIGNASGIFTNIKPSSYNALTIANNVAGYVPGMTPFTGPLVLSIKSAKGGDALLYNEIYFHSYGKIQKLDLVTYWWSDGTNVSNPIFKASYSGNPIFTKVRFAFYNGKQVLIFGDATTVWANCTVAYVKESAQYWGGGYDMSTWTIQPFTGLDSDLSYLQTATVSREYQLPYLEGNGDNIYTLNTGNLLIGKTSQINTNYKLDVVGKIRADGIVVNTSGADFVFEPTYKLRSLGEVETFINQHKHLPDIAPATEMLNNGSSLGDMQTKLLQKVEELTLYLIKKDKQLTEQEKKYDQLKTEMKQLKIMINSNIEKP